MVEGGGQGGSDEEDMAASRANRRFSSPELKWFGMEVADGIGLGVANGIEMEVLNDETPVDVTIVAALVAVVCINRLDVGCHFDIGMLWSPMPTVLNVVPMVAAMH